MKKLVVIILVISLIAAGLFVLKKRKIDLTQASPAPILQATVTTLDLKTQPVTLTLMAMGVVASDISAVLSTRTSGQVITVYKKEGDTVKKGEKLARIDAADLEAKKQGVILQRQGIAFQVEAKKAEISALEISLETAQESHSRTKELLDIKGASPEQYSQEKADIAKLTANLITARNSVETLQKSMGTLSTAMQEIESLLNYATLISPIDGTVSQILARPGDLATPGKPLMRVASQKGLYLNISLPFTLHADEVIMEGRTLQLTSKNQTGETGLMQYVAPLQENIGLVEGQFTNVNVVVYKGLDVLLPIDALLTMNGSSSIFILTSDGKAQQMTVRIKARGIEGVTVDQNLAGLKVILAKPDILLRIATGVPVVERKL